MADYEETMYEQETNYKFFPIWQYHTVWKVPRQEGKCGAGSDSCPAKDRKLLFPEGLAVGAGVHGGVHLVGTHQDAVQGAVVLGIAVVSAGLDGAFDALVCMTVHNHFLL